MRRRSILVGLLAALVLAPAGCTMDSENPAMRRIFGPAPKALVRQMFESPDPDLRREAIDKLSAKDYGQREPYLKGYAALATDPAPTVRSSAVRALGRGKDPGYVNVVLEALKDANTGVRWDAAAALDLILDPKAVEPLARTAANDDSVDVRIAATRALRHYRTREAAGALLHCLEDADFSVRFQAAESLKELTGESIPPDHRAWRDNLVARGYSLAPAPPRRSRPWWDWMGVAQRQTAESDQTSGAHEKPWWDWMGVTQRQASATQPATAPR